MSFRISSSRDLHVFCCYTILYCVFIIYWYYSICLQVLLVYTNAAIAFPHIILKLYTTLWKSNCTHITNISVCCIHQTVTLTHIWICCSSSNINWAGFWITLCLLGLISLIVWLFLHRLQKNVYLGYRFQQLLFHLNSTFNNYNGSSDFRHHRRLIYFCMVLIDITMI